VNTSVVVYRDAQAEDAESLAALGRKTFVDTFGHLYSPKDLAAFCDEIYAPAAQASIIAHPKTHIRIAAQGAELVGYLQMGEFKLPFNPGGRRAMEIHRLYVVERVKGVGVAAALMDWALTQMHAHGAQDAFLGVYQDNPRAQRFYMRHGFEIVGAYKFPVGATIDDEFIMRRSLEPVIPDSAQR
jgi:ribosomal protein S18 acetylase RimI-like enzyme